MSSLASTSPASLAAQSPHERIRGVDMPDGRRLKRQRNIETVREAIIELLASGVAPSIAEIASRSHVTTRSVYRYFGDAEAAVNDAVASRRQRALAMFRSEPAISVGASFDERLALMVLRRLRLLDFVLPVGDRFDVFGDPGMLAALDDEVRRAFAQELAAGSSDDELAVVLCGVFRLGALGAIHDASGRDEVSTARAMCRLVGLLLGRDETVVDVSRPA